MTNFNLNVGGFFGALLGLVLIVGVLFLTQGEYMRVIVKVGIFGVILLSGGGNWLWSSLASSKAEEVNPNAPPPSPPRF